MMLWTVILASVAANPVLPTVKDHRLELSLVAAEPDIVTPTGIAVDKKGRVFVIENNTHFRPKNYKGPEKDRIRILEDINGDGRADRISTFFEGTTATMNLGFRADGALYAATRSDILVFEKDSAGELKSPPRKVVRLRTRGDYPHNGLSGFAFDLAGNVYFGLGENLGVPYSLVGADGVVLTGGGEGGNVYTCRSDGSALRKIATGFWNPFHLFLFPPGSLFVVDNDPDARPPCRLLHVVQGGDYGFKFRYGRNGLHPFHAWNGELPGTLPMVSGTGEAPSGIAADFSRAFPADCSGSLLITSWGDHRIERYRLQPSGASFRATMEPVVGGDENFRPVGIATAPDGSVYFSDWVDKSYDLHGKGRIWRLRPKARAAPGLSQPEIKNAALTALGEAGSTLALRHGEGDVEFPSPPSPHQRAALLSASGDVAFMSRLLAGLDDADPFIRCAARQGLREALPMDGLIDLFRKQTGQRRSEILLVLRDLGADPSFGFLGEALKDPDPTTRLIAVQWVGDKKLRDFRPALDAMLAGETRWTRPLLESTLAAIEILEKGYATPEAGAGFAVRLLDTKSFAPDVAARLLRIIPPDHEWLTADRYKSLATSAKERLAVEAVRSLRESKLPTRTELLEAIALDADREDSVRAEAILGLPADSEAIARIQRDSSSVLRDVARRPPAKMTPSKVNPEADRLRVESLWGRGGDSAAGERLFFDPRGPGCFRCHQVAGRGGRAGPDLTSVAKGIPPDRLISSVVDPSREVAPMYVPWTIVTTDGKVNGGILVREGLKGEQFYVGGDGGEFLLMPEQIDERRPSQESLMPAGLTSGLSDQQILDLFTFLEGLK